MWKRIFSLTLLFFLFLGLATCTHNSQNISQKNNAVSALNSSPKSSSLRIWWSQGFVTEENEVVTRLVNQWKQESGTEAELRLIPNDSMLAETDKAIEQRPYEIVPFRQ